MARHGIVDPHKQNLPRWLINLLMALRAPLLFILFAYMAYCFLGPIMVGLIASR
jgi:hypothetical protein